MSKNKILIVEDESIIALELEDTLKEFGYEILGIVHSGDAAIEIVKHSHPDLILMDIMLKGNITGIEAASSIRNIADIPIIFLTAYADNDTLSKAKITNPYGYLVKPYDPKELNINIQISLQLHGYERKIKENEQLLSKTLKSIGDAVIAINKLNQITLFNSKAESITGYKSDEVVSKNYQDFIRIADQKLNIVDPLFLAENKSSGGLRDEELLLINREGGNIAVLVSVSDIEEDLTGNHGKVMVIKDISSQKKYRQKLIQSEKKYREVVENASEIIFAIDLDGNFTFANKSAQKVCGYSLDELVTKNFRDLVLPEYKSRLTKYYYRQIRQRTLSSYIEFPFLAKNGRVKWFGQNASLIYDDDKILGFEVISRDITDRINSENIQRSILNISEAVNTEMGLDKFYELIHSSINKVMYLDGLYIAFYDDNNDEITFPYSAGFNNGEIEKRNLGNSFTGYVIKSGKAVILNQNEQIRIAKSFNLLLPDKMPVEYIGLPLKVNNKILGVIGVLNYNKSVTYTENDKNILTIFSNQVSLALERKRALQALKESEEDYKGVFENAHDALIVFTPENEIVLDVNNRACEIYGYEKEELIGMSFEDVSTNIAEGKKKIKSTLEKGKTYNFQTVQKKKNGSYIYVEVTASVVNYKGKIAILSINRDITEKTLASIKIQEKNNQLNTLIENIPALVDFKDHEGKYQIVNKSFEKFVGKSKDNIIGKNDAEVLSEELSNQFSKADASDIINNKPIIKEEHITRKDGREIFFETTKVPMTDSGNRIIGLLSISQDITEKKLSLRALEESEKKYKTIFNSAPVGIYQSTLDGRIITANDKLARKLGYNKAEEIILKNIKDFYVDISDRDRKIEKNMYQGSFADMELKWRKVDGEILYVQLSTQALKDERGNILWIEGFVIDITERKKAENALLESEQKYRELFDNSPIGIYRTTPEGTIVMANPAIVKMLSFSSFEELCERNLEKEGFTKISDTRQKFKKEINAENKISGFENAWIKKNGEVIYVSESAKAVRNEKGKIIFYDGTVEDITARKKAEEELSEYQKNLEKLIEERTKKLSESEEMFRALAENIDDTVMRFNKELKILYVNPAVEKLTGVKSSEFLGLTFEEIGFPEAIVSIWKKALKYVLKNKEKKRIEFNLPNGNWVDWMFLPEFDNKGEVNTVLSSARDITERKLSEDNLIKKDKILHGVAEGISKLLLNIDFDKAIMEMLKIVGTAAEVDSISIYENTIDTESGTLVMNQKFRWIKNPKMKNKCTSIIRENYEPDFERWMKNLIKGKPISGMVHDFPYSEQMALSKTKIVSLVAIPIIIHDNFWGFLRLDDCVQEREWSSNELTVLLTLASDLAGAISRREIEERLKKSEERWRTLFEFSPEAYFLIDKDATVIDVNHQAQNLLGYSIKDIYKKSIFDLKIVNENHHSKLVDIINLGINDKPGGPVEIIFITKKDRAIIVEVRLYPVTINNQKQLLFSAQDIRIRKQAEAEIIKALEKAQELNQIKTRFVSMVSHEFRTPLSTILTSVEIIDMFNERLTKEEHKTHLRKIVKSIDYLTAILNDVITINRADSGKLEVKYEEVDIINVMNNLMEDIKASYEEKPSIYFTTNKNYAKVKTDTKLFTQIVSNLLGNAIKYTPIEKNIYLDFKVTEDKIKITIKDEGVGVPEDDQDSLFVPFFRANNIGKTPGSGLGLSITKSCVDMLNGDISFKSKVGEGTTFTVSIPL